MKAGDDFFVVTIFQPYRHGSHLPNYFKIKKENILFKLMLHKNGQKQFLNPLIFPFRLDHLTQMFVFKI